MNGKKGQEEIVGFVIIVVLVVLALLILLGILIRSAPEDIGDSREVLYFLESASEFTTDCEIGRELDFATADSLARDCADGKKCVDGRTACEALNRTFSQLLESAYPLGEDRPVNGYVLEILHVIDREQENTEELMSIERGLCRSNIRGAVHFLDEIDITLRICLED